MKPCVRQSTKVTSLLVSACMGLAGVGAPALAQEAGSEATLNIELNTVSEIDGGCRMIFMAENQMSADIDALVLEAVLFTAEGGVDRLTLLDFQDLPMGRPRVRQFDISGPECSGLGQVLINGIHACEGEGVATDACRDNLHLGTRTDHEVLG